ncbi:U32 family peptidase, partial [Erysipelatoclostridium ramosum]|nr:U32 family peptidase [Thomasclavelia ramosa]
MTMVQETGGLHAGTEVFCDTSLNMTNSYTAAFLLHHVARGVSFSLESSLEDCIAIKQCFQERYAVDAPFLYTVYSRDELMLSEYCPSNSVICKRTSRNCGLCRQGAEYALIDVKKHRYPILCDDACRT